MIKLDFSLKTTEERLEFLNNLLNSEKNFTNSELEKMGDYLLFFENDFKINDCDTRREAHERVSKDAKNGLRTYVIFKDKIDRITYDNNKKISISANLIDLLYIKKQKKSLIELKEKIKNKDYIYFNDKGLSKNKIKMDINKDLFDLNDGKTLFNVKSHGGEFSKFDIFNLDYIDYTNEDFIYEVLKNADYIERQTPPSNLFYICLDFIDATKNIKFTKHQQEVLYMIRNGENISKEGENIKLILKKYSNYFKKNKK